jgi:hypothetical protein
VVNDCVAREASAAEAARLVAEDMRTITRGRSPSAKAVALRTRARLSGLAGERDAAREGLRASSASFEAAEIPEEAARDRYAYGALLGGDEGMQLQAAALEALRGFGYVNPRGDIATYYPELFRARDSSR